MRHEAPALHPAAPEGTAPQDRWNAPFPEFAYSESRENLLRRCARAYYHATFTSWRGWCAPVGSEAWLAYRCKKTTPLAAAVGTVVHDAATRCVRALAAGRPLPSVHELRRDAGNALNAMWTGSRSNRQEFLHRPSSVATPMLQEILYREGPSADMLARARARLNRTLHALVRCDELWFEVAGTTPAGIIIPDRFNKFTLAPDGITVFAAPDLVLAQPGERPVIVDFKSSGADAVVDQILTYGVAGRDGMKLDMTNGCVGQVVALDAPPGERVGTFVVSPEEIDDAADRIRGNVGRMRERLNDVGTNAPKPMESFAQTRDPRICRGCAYRALCWPERHSIAGAAKAVTTAGP
jgi:hypothetical protein